MNAERMGLACPRRKKAPVRRRAARVRRVETDKTRQLARDIFDAVQFDIRRSSLTATEKLLFMFMALLSIAHDKWPSSMTEEELVARAGWFLKMPLAAVEKLRAALVAKGIIQKPNPKYIAMLEGKE